MKVYIINLRKVRKIMSALLVLVLSVFATTGIILGVDNAFMVGNTDIPDNTRVIIIDPGHGGEDCGAVGASGVYEKNLNLEISVALSEALTEAGYTVVMTRTEDKMLYSEEENIKGMRKLSDLKNRCKIAAEYPGALMISIHMNSFGAPQYSGLQVYYENNNESSNQLAQSIQASVKEKLQPENDRVIKNGKGLYLLDNSPVTTVLVECGFLSNDEECKNLSEKEYQKQLSFAVSCGIIEYIEAQQN